MTCPPSLSTALLGSIRAQAGATEAAGRLPEAIVAGLRDSGVLGAFLPAELGGGEVAPPDLAALIEAVSAADGSTGWCTAVSISMNVLAGYLPEAGAREIFTHPAVISGGSFQPSGRATVVGGGDALRVSGRWQFGSGVLHADWMGVASLVVGPDGDPLITEEGRPDARVVWFPAADATVHDTWDVMGLQGTGSHDFEVVDLDVPVQRTMPFRFEPWPAGTFWQTPAMSLVMAPFTAVPLGIAQAAIDELVALAEGGKTPYRSSRPLAERDVVQSMAARAEALVASARAFLHAALTDVARSGTDATMRQRAQVRLAVVNAASAAREATGLCFEAAGSTSLARDHPLSRQFRDVHTAGQHVVLAFPGYETVGRVMFGLDPDTALV